MTRKHTTMLPCNREAKRLVEYRAWTTHSNFFQQHLYAMYSEARQAFKFGISAAFPTGRLAQLKVECPDLEMFGAMKTTASRELETLLLKTLKPWKIEGEWFGVTPATARMAEAIRSKDFENVAAVFRQLHVKRPSS